MRGLLCLRRLCAGHLRRVSADRLAAVPTHGGLSDGIPGRTVLGDSRGGFVLVVFLPLFVIGIYARLGRIVKLLEWANGQRAVLIRMAEERSARAVAATESYSRNEPARPVEATAAPSFRTL